MSDRRLGLNRVAGLLAIAVLGTAQGARAQEVSSRVALNTPEAVCRTAPSHSASVAAALRIAGQAWAAVMRVERIATDEGGETWIQVTPPLGLLARWITAEGCWVPERMVASTEGAGHLVALADPLVSADALPPLDHLLGAHNLFVSPRHHEQVERSPALAERREALMARALEAAQWPGPGTHRPVDRDPRIITWIESLGDRVRYSEGPSGRGIWTLSAQVPAVRPEPGRGESASAPQGSELAVIVPDAACRARPSRTSSGPTALRLDLHFWTDRADTVVAGESWVLHPREECWVLAAHTAPGDTDEHVLLIADRFLTSGEGWSSRNHLSLLTVLSSRDWGHRDVVDGSAELGLRRLQLLRRTLREFPAMGPGPDAVTLAWIGSLGGDVALTDEGHAWTVSDEAYLTLYERHRSDPFAEEIMWEFASESNAYTCEGHPVCVAARRVGERLARYWTDFPQGRHIAEAIETGRTMVAYALEQCSAARAAGPDSRAASNWEWYRAGERVPQLVRELLGSLAQVNEEDRVPLTEVLGELEECAAAISPGCRPGGAPDMGGALRRGSKLEPVIPLHPSHGDAPPLERLLAASGRIPGPRGRPAGGWALAGFTADRR